MTRLHARVNARLSRQKLKIEKSRVLLLRWFRHDGRSFPWRDPHASQYARIVSELLLQRTRAETVAKFFPGFLRRFPNWIRLASASNAQLQEVLEPIGLWRRRAASLKALAKEINARRGAFPSSRDELESLPGVGQYVANATMLFCHGGQEPLLDAGMARVLERCFGPRKLVDIRYDPWLQALAKRVVSHHKSIELNWALLDLAATVCKVRQPTCNACPLRSCCRQAARRNLSGPSESLSPTVTGR
jgi:A/G-specific adenine glycosylase